MGGMNTNANREDDQHREGDPEDANEGRLRSAMLDDGQPGIPWWLPLPGIAVALTWAAYQAVSAEEPGADALLAALLWPGGAIFVITTLVTFFGWRLDLD